MPNSSFLDTCVILDLITRLDPDSILDVGAGFGRWGLLCRCHLGKGESLQLNPGQRPRIDAVEVHAPNAGLIYQAVYNHTYLGDACEVVPTLGTYDVVVCSQMIEHLPKEKGWQAIRAMAGKARMAVILGLPFNDPMRGAVDGNDHESHLSVWRRQDFAGESVFVKEIPFVKPSTLGVVVYPLSPEARWSVRQMKHPWRSWVSQRMGWMTRRRATRWDCGGCENV